MPAEAKNTFGLDGGLETSFIARAKYAHRIDLGDSRLYARFTFPFAAPDLGDFGADAGLDTRLFGWRDWRVALQLGPLLRRTENDLFSATALGLGATMLLGYEGAQWGISAELGYEQFLTTYMKNSDIYREQYFADAKNGWYALSGSTARGGLRGGARIGAVEIFARAGIEATGRFNGHSPPLYATIGTSYAF